LKRKSASGFDILRLRRKNQSSLTAGSRYSEFKVMDDFQEGLEESPLKTIGESPERFDKDTS
jgi:hypothetical protein